MKSPIRSIEIPQYIKYVQLSKKRRAKYYLRTSKKKLPKKYADLKFNKKGILVHKDGTPVIANPRSMGTPRLKKINGQEIYSGMPYHMRSKIVRAIKDSFSEILKKVEPVTEFPVQLTMELHDEIGNGDWDLDNLWIYNKCFQDALVENGVLPSDSIKYITKPATPEFFPVKDQSERKLVWRIYEDDRDSITEDPYYTPKIHEDF